MSKYRVLQNYRGKWIVADWMALSEHDTEQEAQEAARRYEENEAKRNQS